MAKLLGIDAVDAVVARCVRDVEAIDVHTHLLPPTHGNLLLWGIDELLTYHYLVAELFMVMPCVSEEDSVSVGDAAPSPDDFYGWPKPRQAELVFEELFVKRTPLSEACRGVVTTLSRLGRGEQLRAAVRLPSRPRLTALRDWFAAQDASDHLERVFRLSKLKYAGAGAAERRREPVNGASSHTSVPTVMTNIPFAPEEAEHWTASPQPPLTPRLKTALRVDPMLVGDWRGICSVLRRASPPHPLSMEGCVAYLKEWVRRIRPIYLMASTPAGFTYTPTAAGPAAAELLEGALLRVAMEEGLPLALKVGAVRGANPALQAGGDGVEVSRLDWLRTLCAGYPSVKFLVTVLSAVNQHELCVLARKFGNLHVYGCWWFCNNPSIIETTTRMRLEMLGTAFTCQHSDARARDSSSRPSGTAPAPSRRRLLRAQVLDQLVYKWAHSREAVTPVLAAQYRKLLEAGWPLSEADVERDVGLLFGGAYEEFLAK
ncbi:hypothetical protein EMIHUDRAFT_96482 [Emiliania huxleyi CCMP1516]|uniref:Glucuronate isomerase n=2 Tax=Emiliania huxleyi TaxID=2903 RepID=A0A0D3IU83_EMIH1|nr:hypothetical protein EMIHUDRAFT_96482 [Emiliania huxleyi CCMP1516]EOD14818.1 hypothetical protein EMIHUDRAFT_96482 [Emiliania huxleyi CCMP1516]|eukprot:XP_005767247.1 hypothetical protein EMIHUDRAFT_96482 [Emiliania huxleyi CCMP1516]